MRVGKVLVTHYVLYFRKTSALRISNETERDFGKIKATDGTLWQLMATYGNLWQFLATYGIFWQHLATYCNLWQLMETYGNFWQLLATYGNLVPTLVPPLVQKLKICDATSIPDAVYLNNHNNGQGPVACLYLVDLLHESPYHSGLDHHALIRFYCLMFTIKTKL